MLHELLGLPSFSDLEAHPKLGASREGFVIEEILGYTGDRDAYFWATQSSAELDFLLFWRGKRIGIEIKYADAPRFTPSMHAARNILGLSRLFIVYPGEAAYPVEKDVEVLPLSQIRDRLAGI